MKALARELGLVDYAQCWSAMQSFSAERTPDTADEFWSVEHAPVYTLGKAGRPEHVIAAGDIPVVTTDRGGQVTYHGPGQIVIYTLIDVRRLGIGPRELVRRLEQGLIDWLGGHDIDAARRKGAPGVYVGEAKLAALGLRITRGCSYHGIAMNNTNNLEPFTRIDPCGYQGLAVTSLSELGVDLSREDAARTLTHALGAALFGPTAEPAQFVPADDALTWLDGTHESATI